MNSAVLILKSPCTYSLLPIRCPPLSSSPHPTLSLRLGESFLLCVSPPCGAEAGGRTGAPCFFCYPLSLYFWSDTDTALHFTTISTSACHYKELFFFSFTSYFSSFSSPATSTSLSLRSRFWAHRWSGGITPRGRRRRRGVERGGEGAGHREVVPKLGSTDPREVI